jgi:crotonobetainyl-CoA:carnitine CoA-transferase CaiB-like acyl-CoA transferase
MSLTTQNWNWTDSGSFMLAKVHPPSIHQSSIYECANGEWIHAPMMAGVTPTRSEADILGLESIRPIDLLEMEPADVEDYMQRRRDAFKVRDRTELLAELIDAGLGGEAIIPPHERFDHPQLRATGSVVEVADPEVGPTTQIGLTVFLDGTPGEVRGPQPLPGAHTDEVLRALGHDDAELATLRAEGVI